VRTKTLAEAAAEEVAADLLDAPLAEQEIWGDRADALVLAVKLAHSEGRQMGMSALVAWAARRGWERPTLDGALQYCEKWKMLTRYQASDGDMAFKIPFTKIFDDARPPSDPVPFKVKTKAEIVAPVGLEGVDIKVTSITPLPAPLGSEEALDAAKEKRRSSVAERVAAQPKSEERPTMADEISAHEAGKLLGVTANGVTQMVARGDLESVSGGGRGCPRMYSRAVVEKLAASRARRADPEERHETVAARSTAIIRRASIVTTIVDDAEPSDAVKRAVEWLYGIAQLLIEKNAGYGDSAANPVRIFSRASTIEQLLVRIDDKLSRIARGNGLVDTDEDVVKDLVGYLALLAAVKEEK
jgi:hypothetical protein